MKIPNDPEILNNFREKFAKKSFFIKMDQVLFTMNPYQFHEKDYEENVVKQFEKLAKRPIVNWKKQKAHIF